ncbi:hypothetical protein A4U61_27790 [Streptomyces sp. H-KF8]|nr:hypothetical protein A4U61_27790 [Streptomyces sp. H-KF8]
MFPLFTTRRDTLIGHAGVRAAFPASEGEAGRTSAGPADGHAVVRGRRVDTAFTAEPQTRTAESAIKLVRTSWSCVPGK